MTVTRKTKTKGKNTPKKVVPKTVASEAKNPESITEWTSSSETKTNTKKPKPIRQVMKRVTERALKARNAVLQKPKKSIKAKKSKVRTSVSFRRPHTLRLKRNPKYPRHLEPVLPKNDLYSVFKHPLNSEQCMKLLEDHNTITFIVNSGVNKNVIKNVMQKKFELKVAKVTTLNMINGEKKAYIRLKKESDAIQFANTIGMI